MEERQQVRVSVRAGITKVIAFPWGSVSPRMPSLWKLKQRHIDLLVKSDKVEVVFLDDEATAPVEKAVVEVPAPVEAKPETKANLDDMELPDLRDLYRMRTGKEPGKKLRKTLVKAIKNARS